jgi:3-oxoacyl-[acyl-carrier protein] reductase
MEVKLDGKVAIVTGAGHGLGEAIAQALGRAGAGIAVNDLNPDRAERVAAAIRAEGGQAIAVVADVANKFHCVSLVEKTRAEWGRLDILVNNAAVAPTASILKMDEWDWNRCVDVNLKGVFFMSQLCGRVMVDENRSRGGVIVNINSVAGVNVPLEQRAAYCATQAGVTGFARECAREFAPYGVRVNTVLVGLSLRPSSRRPQPLPETPLIVTPQDVAQAVLFLASPAAKHLTGSVIQVGSGA